MVAEMPVCVQHVSFEEEVIVIRLFAPTIIADLLEHLSCLAADSEEPAVRSQGNVLQTIPEVLPQRRVLQKAPVFVFG